MCLLGTQGAILHKLHGMQLCAAFCEVVIILLAGGREGQSFQPHCGDLQCTWKSWEMNENAFVGIKAGHHRHPNADEIYE